MASTARSPSPFSRGMLDVATDVWHQYRIPLLLSTFAVLVALRVYLYFTEAKDGRDGLLVFPRVYDSGTETAGKGAAAAAAASKPLSDVKATANAWSKATAQAVAATAATATATVTATNAKKATGPRRIKGELPPKNSNGTAAAQTANLPERIQTLVFFSSLTGGTAQRVNDYADMLGKALRAHSVSADKGSDVFLPPKVLDIAEIDLDDYFLSPPKETAEEEGQTQQAADHFYLFLVPSYNIDSINDTFLEHLKETHHDFRVDSAPLSPLLGYAVFGLGDREGWPTEADGFCFQAKEIDKWMAKLTARKRAFPLGCGDIRSDVQERLAEWSDGVVDVLGLLARTGSLGEGISGSGDPIESDEEDEYEEEEESGEETDGNGRAVAVDGDDVLFARSTTGNDVQQRKKAGDATTLDDVEDLGRLLQRDSTGASTGSTTDDSELAPPTRAPIAIDFTSYAKDPAPRRTGGKRGGTTAAQRAAKQPVPAPPLAVKEMVAVDSPTHKSLTKQGYAIVGSHSGVKICRWTKSALRGRGSCYKYSFYGIHSHQCMETTPSLSCSNKCVFCWRHGTNPVGTTWRWVVDPPELIFDGVKANHYAKIKNLRGVPGVRAERFAEAMRIRHCALSLVGEPIFYPHINEFLGMLHGDSISSFLVCNAQHPDQLAALHHVTQLYVSIDATDRETLRRIDRPLHRDFWERFQRCLQILRAQRFRQRTVFRLTLVKGFNVEDAVHGYADLVEQALPCFVEVKGVTYCGTSTAAGVGLTMANVPFYHEVCAFVVALEAELQARGLGYGLAAEHAHSCCVLLASDRFRARDGSRRWHTLIDYDKFFALLRERGPTGDFAPEDYMGALTPEWATWGRGGFDPRDARVDRKGRPLAVAASPAAKMIEA